MRRNRTTAPPPPTRVAAPAFHIIAAPLTHSALQRFLASYTDTAAPEQRLRVARAAFALIARDETARSALEDYGYDAAKLEAGLRLMVHAKSRLQHRQQCDRALGTARHLDDVVQARAYITYQRCLRLARKAVRDEPAFIDMVDLTPPRRQELKLWQAHAQQLYDRISTSPELATQLSKYGFSIQLLMSIQRQIATALAGLELRHISQGRALLVSRASAGAFALFDRWMRDFLVLAQIALAEQQSPLALLPLPITA